MKAYWTMQGAITFSAEIRSDGVKSALKFIAFFRILSFGSAMEHIKMNNSYI